MKIAINGFGRIGRNTLRNIVLRNANIEIVAINDLTDVQTLAHLFKYDSVHGPYTGEIYAEGDFLVIDNRRIAVFKEKEPSQLPWKNLEIDVVIESTGRFTTLKLAEEHLTAGAKQVVISAPSADKEVPIVVLGINDDMVDLTAKVLSNASCTTNNVAPLIKVLDRNW